MRILSLEAENIKRLRAVEITPTGDVIEITGRNGMGKSSILDCITYALAGAKAIDWEPIRHGCEKALIRLELGDDAGVAWTVTRRFTNHDGAKYTDGLTIKAADGSQPKGQQALLDSLTGRLTFDPLDFARLPQNSKDGKSKVAILKALVEGIDFDEIAAERQKVYERRTGYNRDARAEAVRAERMDVPKDAPEEAPDLGALQREFEAINQERETSNLWRLHADRLDQAIRDTEAQIKALQDRLEADRERRKGMENARPPEPRDPAPVLESMKNIQAQFDAFTIKSQFKAAVAAAERSAKLADKATARIDELDAMVEEAIAKAKLPVPGLKMARLFPEDADYMVMLNGVPFEQASGAEQLRASMGIGMALNPDLRVLRTKDGGLLDEDSMAIVIEMCRGKGFQLWAESVVPHEGTMAIEIVNGEIKEAPKPAKRR